jgi:hypothetical protein
VDDPGRGIINVRFFSDRPYDLFSHAVERGHELGLRVERTLGSGWVSRIIRPGLNVKRLLLIVFAPTLIRTGFTRIVCVHNRLRSDLVRVTEFPEVAERVEGWGFVVPWSPKRQQPVTTAREELLDSLKKLTGVWELKTGRPATTEQWIVQHRFLAAAGFPKVVLEFPAGAELEQCWQFRCEGEPDLVVSLYRVKAPRFPRSASSTQPRGAKLDKRPRLSRKRSYQSSACRPTISSKSAPILRMRWTFRPAG